jgi:hypothetical protein
MIAEKAAEQAGAQHLLQQQKAMGVGARGELYL